MPEVLGLEVAAAREAGRPRNQRNPTPLYPHQLQTMGRRYPQSIRAQALAPNSNWYELDSD